MANNDNVIASPRKILQGDVAQDRPNSESVMNKFGGSINYLLDRSIFFEDFVFNGYFSPEISGARDGYGGIRRIAKQSEILGYYFVINKAGTSGDTAINFKLDDLDGFTSTIFDTSALNLPQISGGTNDIVCIGRDLITSTTIEQNPNGNSVQFGTLNSTIIEANNLIIPSIVSRATKAQDAFFRLILREI